MRKIAFVISVPALVASLGGCAAPHDAQDQVPANIVSKRPAAASVDVGVDWNWMVSGDTAVRPVQVFSLNGKTYFQMDSRQIMPVLIVNGAPIPFGISPPYLVIQGVPQQIEIVANGYRAIVAHIGPEQQSAPVTPSSAAYRVQRVSMAAQIAQPQTVAQSLPAPTVRVQRMTPMTTPWPSEPDR